jgi:tRNA(Ile2) C34 agmatinyltransferase TiaS
MAEEKIEQIKEVLTEEKCPTCGSRLYSDGENMWCSNKDCDYEWFL